MKLSEALDKYKNYLEDNIKNINIDLVKLNEKYNEKNLEWLKNMRECDDINYEIRHANQKIKGFYNELEKIFLIFKNQHRYKSINHNEINTFSEDKLIYSIKTLSETNLESKSKGNIDGELSGGMMLGFGRINGDICGEYNSNTTGKSTEIMLVEYSYNLDYEIFEPIFSAKEYLKNQLL